MSNFIFLHEQRIYKHESQLQLFREIAAAIKKWNPGLFPEPVELTPPKPRARRWHKCQERKRLPHAFRPAVRKTRHRMYRLQTLFGMRVMDKIAAKVDALMKKGKLP